MAYGDTIESVVRTTNQSIVFGTTPSSGELIVIFAANRNWDGDPASTGFTRIFAYGQQYRGIVTALAKVAGAAETNSYGVTGLIASSDLYMWGYRIEGPFSDLDGLAGYAGGTGTLPVDVPVPGLSVSAGDVCFAILAGDYCDAGIIWGFSNSYSEAYSWQSTQYAGVLARKAIASGETTQTTISASGSVGGIAGLLHIAGAATTPAGQLRIWTPDDIAKTL